MAIIIAIIGQAGVGKSLLKHHLVKQGAIPIDLTEIVDQAIGKTPFSQTWRHCLYGRYSEIASYVRVLVTPELSQLVHQEIDNMRALNKIFVMEIPSFISVSLYADLSLDAKVLVDCNFLDHTNHLKCLGASDTVIHLLRANAQSQDAYRSIATDVFHNSIAMDQIEWVAKKILQSYSCQLMAPSSLNDTS